MNSREEIRQLLDRHVPEVQSGRVQVISIHRLPGLLTKVVLASREPELDPIRAAVGDEHGSRLRKIVEAIGGERVDLIPFDEEPTRLVCDALAPLRVQRLVVDEEDQCMLVVVADEDVRANTPREQGHLKLAANVVGWDLIFFKASDWQRSGEESVPFWQSRDLRATNRANAVKSDETQRRPLADVVAEKAEQAVLVGKERGVSLDYSEKSLESLDALLGDLARTWTEPQRRRAVSLFQSYVLEVGRRAYGGKVVWWRRRKAPVLVSGAPDCAIGLCAVDKIEGRLMKADPEDNIPFFYEGFAQRLRTAKPGDRATYV